MMSDQNFTTHAVDKIASSTALCQLSSPVTVSPYVVAQHGYAVAVKALEEKPHYNQVECIDGVFRTIRKGDVIVGALGERQALKGYSGTIPRHVEAGDWLNVLNLGGIIGKSTSELPELGPALRVEVLGAVMVERNGQAVHARIQDGALEHSESLDDSAPLVIVSGTAMDTGKTLAATRIVQGLTEKGLDVAAAKLTGASLMRDVQKMREHGAMAAATFTDAGIVCSTEGDMAPVAKGVLQHLNDEDPDVIVLEMGDGFVGYYGVDDLLLDREIQRHTKAHVVAATDLAGAWAAEQMFTQRYRAPITAITGPVTDNDVGCRYIENRLGIAGINARQSPNRLTERVHQAIEGELSGDELNLPSMSSAESGDASSEDTPADATADDAPSLSVAG
jgi:molybdopterin-guanine dinucleotide biosynthesis protein